MRQDRRGSWYLLTGAVLGIAIGLFYSWVISPVEYVDAPPYALRADFKDEYRALVAAAYLYSGDLLRAGDRLAQLKADGNAQVLAMQAQRALAEGHPEGEVKALGILAMALGQQTSLETVSTTPTSVITDGLPISTNTQTPLVIQTTASPAVSPQLSPTQTDAMNLFSPTDTVMPVLTNTSTPTQGLPFLLKEIKLVCNLLQHQPLIQVMILNAAGQPIPSVEVVVMWDGGEDHFFTGLKPELSLGYADFVLTPKVVYSLHLASGGQTANDLTAAECMSGDNDRYWGSWLLTFVQP
jgi:hypothetical protein